MRQVRYLEDKILCSKCNEYKSPEEFCPSSLKKRYWCCKVCLKKYRTKAKSRINFLIDSIYFHQTQRNEVNYSWEEFANWVMNNKKFMSLYSTWLTFDKHKDLVPSIIRKDPNKSFTLDNLFVATVKETKTIINRKRSKPIIQIDPKTGQEIARFDNACSAAKILNFKRYTNIRNVCIGGRKTSYGYIWKYAN